MKVFSLLFTIFLIVSASCFAQKKTDTIKCYVQIMIPAPATIGISRQIDDNYLFNNGGLIIYTKAFAIVDLTGKYILFLNPKGNKIKDVWNPENPSVMKFDWK